TSVPSMRSSTIATPTSSLAPTATVKPDDTVAPSPGEVIETCGGASAPAASIVPFGVPVPVGPSPPAPAVHRGGVHVPFGPGATPKNIDAFLYENDGPALLCLVSA